MNSIITFHLFVEGQDNIFIWQSAVPVIPRVGDKLALLGHPLLGDDSDQWVITEIHFVPKDFVKVEENYLSLSLDIHISASKLED